MDPLPLLPRLFPPHARGWTARRDLRFPRMRGDGPFRSVRSTRHRRFPRMRGDGPSSPRHASGMDPERIVVSPACAGMDPSIVSPFGVAELFPPHARGWTQAIATFGTVNRVSPACAGMDPQSPNRCDPVSPACAGMDPPEYGARLVFPPHARGWTSRFVSDDSHALAFPPHARGWTVSPASTRAGMDRGVPLVLMRGDGPLASNVSRAGDHVSPACAGMDPS